MMEEKKSFDPHRYKEEWKKQNLRQVKASYKAEFVEEFKQACAHLGITQSEVIRQAMLDTIEKAKKS